MGTFETKNRDRQAFPSTDGKTFASDGLTKREYFAGLAMQGLMANQDSDQYSTGDDFTNTMENKARFCVMLADELLRQLEL